MPIAGEEICVLIIEGQSDDDPEIRVFAQHSEAVEVWHEVLDEAIQFSEIESLDELPVYRRGVVFEAPNGVRAEVRTVEVE